VTETAVGAGGAGGSRAEDGAAGSDADDGERTERDAVSEVTAIDGVGEVTAAALADAGYDSPAAVAAADPASLTTVEGIGEKQAVDVVAAAAGMVGAAPGSGEPTDEPDDTAARTDDRPAGGPGGGDPATNSPSDTLQQAMDLLAAHDDRWRESSGDEPHEVDLPDGSTEGVRTKDDVKRLLFKHWR
jgi:predicted flap endonuclease-1-like 5' DNA nuclease